MFPPSFHASNTFHQERLHKLQQENAAKSAEVEAINSSLKKVSRDKETTKKKMSDTVRKANHLKVYSLLPVGLYLRTYYYLVTRLQAKVAGCKKQLQFSEKQKRDQELQISRALATKRFTIFFSLSYTCNTHLYTLSAANMEREAEIAEKRRELAAMKEEHATVSISFLELSG